ncbi:MAG: hypothetical protein RMX65_005370 [Nostoc sp. DedQUE01]
MILVMWNRKISDRTLPKAFKHASMGKNAFWETLQILFLRE